jgi:hypothetical protein
MPTYAILGGFAGIMDISMANEAGRNYPETPGSCQIASVRLKYPDRSTSGNEPLCHVTQ